MHHFDLMCILSDNVPRVYVCIYLYTRHNRDLGNKFFKNKKKIIWKS